MDSIGEKVNQVPQPICRECALLNGGKITHNHISSYYFSRCSWCEKEREVSNSMDYTWIKNQKMEENS